MKQSSLGGFLALLFSTGGFFYVSEVLAADILRGNRTFVQYPATDAVSRGFSVDRHRVRRLQEEEEDHHDEGVEHGHKLHHEVSEFACKKPEYVNVTASLQECMDSANELAAENKIIGVTPLADDGAYFAEGRNVEEVGSGITGPVCAVVAGDGDGMKLQYKAAPPELPEEERAGSHHPFVQWICGAIHGGHYIAAFKPVVLMLLVFALSSITSYVEHHLPPLISLPHTVLLFFLGMLLGLSGGWDMTEDQKWAETITTFQNMDPHCIFWILLPPLLFEDASGSNWHVFKRISFNAFLLAIPGVIMNTVITGALINYTFDFSVVNMTWFAICLLASILSATDPVAVIGALNALKAPVKLSTLIAGEALMNDGSAVVLFKIFQSLANGRASLDLAKAAISFCRLAFGGLGLGLAMSLFLYVVLKITKKLFHVQVMLILGVTYTTFFVAEQHEVNVSAVLATVVVGYFMAAHGNNLIPSHRHHDYHAILHFLALLANESIFLVAGMVCHKYSYYKDGNFDPSSWGNFAEVLLLYGIIHLSRGTVLLFWWPVMRKFGYGLTFKELIICLMGGLRGAVGLALAMLVDLDRSTDKLPREVASRIAFHVSWITILTLVVNGTCVTWIYERLKIYPKPRFHHSLHMNAVVQAEAHSKEQVKRLEQNWFFTNSFLDLVLEAVPLMANKKQLEKAKANTTIQTLNLNDFVTEAMLRARDAETAEDVTSRYMTKAATAPNRSEPNVFAPDEGGVTQAEVDNIVSQTICMTLAKKKKKGASQNFTNFTSYSKRPVHTHMRPGRTPQNVCISSLANSMVSVNFSRNGTRGRKPLFGINKNNDECELRSNVYFCGRGSGDVSCSPSLNGQCANCKEFQLKMEAGELGWGPMTLNENQRMAARKRWKTVRKNIFKFMKVRSKLKKGPMLNKDHLLEVPNNAHAEAQIVNMDDFLADSTSMGEVYLTVHNSIEARLHEMHEAGIIARVSYQKFHHAFEYFTDAINGEASNQKFFRGTELEGLHDLPPQQQMRKSLSVLWHAIKWGCDPMNSHRFSIYKSLFSKLFTNYVWQSYIRDIEVVLTFVFILESFIHDEGTHDLVELFPDVKLDIKRIIADAKNNYLLELCKREPGIFVAAEHLLALRTMVHEKLNVLDHFVLNGLISQGEANGIKNGTLLPMLNTLSHFKPSTEHITINNTFELSSGTRVQNAKKKELIKKILEKKKEREEKRAEKKRKKRS